MKSRRLLAVLLLAGVSAVATGCRGGGMGRGRLAATEPALDPMIGTDPIVAEAPPPTVTWVDRHPLFHKPREYYENTGGGKFAKTATATVVGVPAGFVGEMKQIFVGRPRNSVATY